MGWLDSVSFHSITERQNQFSVKYLKVTHFLLVVIGRGGEQISRLQQESGCKIQIAPGKFGSQLY